MGAIFFSCLRLTSIWSDATRATQILHTTEIAVSLCWGKEHSPGAGGRGLCGWWWLSHRAAARRERRRGLAEEWRGPDSVHPPLCVWAQTLGIIKFVNVFLHRIQVSRTNGTIVYTRQDNAMIKYLK